jgi:quercetin dioxygenase-like cupin family protein
MSQSTAANYSVATSTPLAPSASHAARQCGRPWTFLGALLLATQGALAQAPASPTYEKSSTGLEVLRAPNGLEIEILVEVANLGGGEIEVARITFPGSSRGAVHRHGAIEVLYVLEGRMDHVVNGVSHVLEPGMIGIVRPEDTVEHRVLSEEPVRVLAVWAPGGEAARLRGVFPASRSQH